MKVNIYTQKSEIAWLRAKLLRSRSKKIKRALKKDNFQKCYTAAENIEEFGKPIFTLRNRDNSLRPAKLSHDRNNFILQEVEQTGGLEVKVLELNNAEVIARSDGFISNNLFYHPDILLTLEEKYETKSQAIKAISNTHGKHIIQIPKSFKKPIKLTGISISLLKEHSFNYYHFIFECLPKLLLIQTLINRHKLELNPSRPVTILIDEEVPAQCLDYIHSAITFTHKIKYLKVNETAYCEKLLYCSAFFNALDNTRVKNFSILDFYVDKYAVQLVKELAESMIQSTTTPYKLLYLDRIPGQKRQIINSFEVKDMLKKYNFEVVFPDTYPTTKQIELFNNARCVIGASGAAFTNLIHMRAGTTAIMLSPSLSFTNYHLFQQQADASSVNLIHIKTENKNTTKTLHDDVYINVSLLEQLLENTLKTKG